MKTTQKKNRITIELQTDNDKIHQLYTVMNSNGSLSDFIESLVTLRLNNYEAKVAVKEPVEPVKSEQKSDLTFNNSVLNLLYDVKEVMEEIKESIAESPKPGLDLGSIGDVVKSALSSIPVVTAPSVSNVVSENNTAIKAVEEVQPVQDTSTLDLSYLDDQIGNIVKTSKGSDSTSGEDTPPKKKSMKSMNMSKMKKLKGG